MKFGENLYSLRKGAKMSQEKLAEEVGVSRQSVSKWENGESYPEMDNMLKLCKIFHCQINDLVHKDMQDIDSLDEDIKMSVVKLEKGKQKKLKVLSKLIYVFARIGKICARVGIGCIIAGVIVLSIVLCKTNVKSDKCVEFDSSTGIAKYEETDDGRVFVTGYDAKEKKEHTEELQGDEKEEVKKFVNVVVKKSKGENIAYMTVTAIAISATLVLAAISLGKLEKLFINIHDGDTPFTLENVHYIKLMTYFMIATTICSGFVSSIINIFYDANISFSIGFSLIYILFLFSIAYIFEYGYEIQKDSQGKIYGDEDQSNTTKE